MDKSPAGSVFQVPVTNLLPARFTHRETLQEVKGQRKEDARLPPLLLFCRMCLWAFSVASDPAREVPEVPAFA